MKLKFSDLKLALNKIEQDSDKGDITIYISETSSSMILRFSSRDSSQVEIVLFDATLSKFALIKEEKWLVK